MSQHCNNAVVILLFATILQDVTSEKQKGKEFPCAVVSESRGNALLHFLADGEKQEPETWYASQKWRINYN